MAFDPKRLPDSLIEAYREKRCVALVGAGASRAAGLPLWSELLTKMIDEAKRHRIINEPKAREYRKLVKRPEKYLMLATGLKEELGTAYFEPFIRKMFLAPKPKPTKIHDALVEANRLQLIVTTNYDTILERRYREVDADVAVCTFLDVGEVQSRMSKRQFFILKAHGDASKAGRGIILTDMDYRRILYRERAYQSLLSSIFTMFTVVFIGASMTDPEVTLLLHYIADSFSPGSGPLHYAVMAKEEI